MPASQSTNQIDPQILNYGSHQFPITYARCILYNTTTHNGWIGLRVVTLQRLDWPSSGHIATAGLAFEWSHCNGWIGLRVVTLQNVHGFTACWSGDRRSISNRLITADASRCRDLCKTLSAGKPGRHVV